MTHSIQYFQNKIKKFPLFCESDVHLFLIIVSNVLVERCHKPAWHVKHVNMIDYELILWSFIGISMHALNFSFTNYDLQISK